MKVLQMFANGEQVYGITSLEKQQENHKVVFVPKCFESPPTPFENIWLTGKGPDGDITLASNVRMQKFGLLHCSAEGPWNSLDLEQPGAVEEAVDL